MLDDLVIFATAAFAATSSLGEKYARYTKPFGGVDHAGPGRGVDLLPDLAALRCGPMPRQIPCPHKGEGRKLQSNIFQSLRSHCPSNCTELVVGPTAKSRSFRATSSELPNRKTLAKQQRRGHPQHPAGSRRRDCRT